MDGAWCLVLEGKDGYWLPIIPDGHQERWGLGQALVSVAIAIPNAKLMLLAKKANIHLVRSPRWVRRLPTRTPSKATKFPKKAA